MDDRFGIWKFDESFANGEMALSEIRDFYQDKNVLITGGTGFLGKVLVEKLLRSTDVATIFVLIRNKKGTGVDQRLQDLFDSALFDKLKTEKPSFMSHVTAIRGDCVVDDLGLSIQDREKLVKNTNIVFHAAATISFNQHIQKCYEINVKGTESLMKLCAEMTDLKAVVHVSTAYSNCHLQSIDEIIYNNPLKYKEVEDILRKLSYEEAKKITPKLLGPWPNTYTFTKNLAEEMLRDHFSSLPLAVFRPGAVSSTYKEPLENWSDTLGVVNIVLKYASLGLLRILPTGHFNTETVPVDLTISALIASAWDLQTRDEKDIAVYNYVSSTDNPLTYYEFVLLTSLQIQNYPIKNCLWLPKLRIIESSSSTDVFMALNHYPLALLLDFFGLLFLKKPKVVYTVKGLHEFIETVKFFMNQDWRYSNQNVKEMWKKMNEKDRVLFNFDITSVQWIDYLRNYFKGVRLYFMKNDLDSLPEAKKKYHRAQVLNEMVVFFIDFFGEWWLIKTFDNMKAKL